MNCLQLINRARQECGITGPDLTTISGLTGESLRFLNWINAAWVDVQTAHEDWQFLRTPFQFNTIAGQWQYTATDAGVGSTFANWKRDSFRASTVGANYGDEQLLNFMDWNTFRNLYQYANMRSTQARPVVVSIVPPSRDLGFGSIPDQAYVIVGEYYRKPTEFVLATEEPDIPPRFHLMIVYRAMMFYAGYEAATEVYQRGELEFKRLMNRLEIDQLPDMVSGPPLA
jgi:hypothetical protein